MFGLAYTEVVVIDRLIDTVTHAFPHAQKEDLVTQQIGHQVLEITDTRGDHRYPADAVLGLHFTVSPDYSGCAVQLWESPDGLYLVDPFDESTRPENPMLWPIRPSWLSARTPFRTIANRLCEQTLQLPETAGNGWTLDQAPPGTQHVATWHHQGGRVEVKTGGDDPTDLVDLVAGQRAQSFIGAQDLNAQPRA